MKTKKLETLGLLAVFAVVILVGTVMLKRSPGTDQVVQELLRTFPNISQESAEKFAKKVYDLDLTDEEVLTWAGELAAKGEMFLSDSQKQEMASLWWKAVSSLPAEQQASIRSIASYIPTPIHSLAEQ